METPTIEQLPIFVYGSLRPGASNFSKVREYIAPFGTRPALMFGLRMFSFGGFPGIVQDQDVEERPVVGEILIIQEDKWAECIEKLDRYENNGFLFNRTDTFFASIWGKNDPVPYYWNSPGANSIRVWTYVVNTGILAVDQKRIVASNDWLNRGM